MEAFKNMEGREEAGNRRRVTRIISFFFLFLILAGIGREIGRGKYRDIGLALYVIPVVRYYYLEPVSFSQLISNYIRSGNIRDMLANLEDPYTRYLNPKEYEDLLSQTEGTYGGVGFYVVYKEEELTIMKPIKNTPAAEVDLRAGDRIIAINGESTGEMALEVAVTKIKGAPGTKVALTIERGEGNNRQIQEVELTRALIVIPTVERRVESDPVAGKIGRVDILQFSEKTPEDLQKALEFLATEGVVGVLLDLRYNPGGLLTAAVETAGCFVGERPVVYVTQRGEKVRTYTPSPAEDWHLPLVVMVNEWSASGAEILAGAIKDYQTGTLVGNTTFGKGVVQDIIPLVNGGAVTLTVAGYLTAGGHSIHGKGIEPDIEIEIGKDLEKAIQDGDFDTVREIEERTEEKAREILRQKVFQARPEKPAA